MPKDLADVLHFFLPELDGTDTAVSGSATAGASHAAGQHARQHARQDAGQHARQDAAQTPAQPKTRPRPRALPSLTLPLIAVPIGERDLVRAALTWNLSVEIARLGGRAIVVAPATAAPTPLWPEAGIGPLGSELVRCPANDMAELQSAALDIAAARTASAPRGGAVFIRVPPSWLDAEPHSVESIRWWLLMTSSHRHHLEDALGCARRIRTISPAAEIGATIHGVSTIAEAQRAYEHLSRRCGTELALELKSYGLLVDDLDVYRAIAAQRPIGLAHPQAPATKALVDVAQLVYDDARSQTLG